ncbi:MAG: RCC1 domain-containing protein [Acidimicrobiia bacterium]
MRPALDTRRRWWVGVGFSLGFVFQACVQTGETQSIVDRWLHCEECTEGERDSVVALGAGAVPLLAVALKGLDSARTETFRIQFSEELHAVDSALDVDSVRFVNAALNRMGSLYQKRAALVLGDLAVLDGAAPNPAGELLQRSLGLHETGVAQFPRSAQRSLYHAVYRSTGRVQWRGVTVGLHHSCGILTSGEGACWGAGADGVLGPGADEEELMPALLPGPLRLVEVSASSRHTCGLTVDRSVYCWGQQSQGRLGNDGDEAFAMPHPSRIEGLRAVAITSGDEHSCSLDEARRAWCWGSNRFSQIGSGDGDSFVSLPAQVALPESLHSISSSPVGRHTCALTWANHAYCWGANDFGQLGAGPGSPDSTPLRVGHPLEFLAISAGGSHTCGVGRDALVYCWGRGDRGQLGNGGFEDHSAPTRVLEETGLQFANVAAGSSYSCGLTIAQDLYCWGDLPGGAEGVESRTSTPVPVPVVSDHRWKSVEGGNHVCGITTLGDAFCWGTNDSGQLGTGTVGGGARPMQVSDPVGYPPGPRASR